MKYEGIFFCKEHNTILHKYAERTAILIEEWEDTPLNMRTVVFDLIKNKRYRITVKKYAIQNNSRW